MKSTGLIFAVTTILSLVVGCASAGYEKARRTSTSLEDAAAAIDAVLVRRPPGPLRDVHDAGKDAGRDPAGQPNGPAGVDPRVSARLHR